MEDAYPVQVFHQPCGGGGGGQLHNLGTAYAAVKLLRPQGHSLVIYAKQRLVFAYPILAGDVFTRLDSTTVAWTEPESGAEFAIGFRDEAACATVCDALPTVTGRPATACGAVDGIAERLARLRMAREEDAPGEGDIAGRLGLLSIRRP